MANPQLEDGYLKIAGELIQALSRINLSPYESRVLFCILNKTYGFHKKEDWITLSQFSKYTGLDKRLVSRALKKLSSKQMITIDKKNQRVVYYGLQKDHDKWDGKVVIQTDDELSSIPMKVVIQTDEAQLPKGNSTKDTVTKNTLTKELQVIVDKFHELGPRLPKCRKLNDTLKAKLRTRLKDKSWLEDFYKAVELADERLGHRTTEWKPRFEYFLRNDDNVQAILEGKFKKYREQAKCKFIYSATEYISARDCTEPAVKFGYCTKHMGS